MTRSGSTQDQPAVSLTKTQFWGILGTILLGLLSIIGVLIGVVYTGVKGDIDEASNRIRELQASYNQAIGSAASVKDLLAKSPELEKTILETYKLATQTNSAMQAQTTQLSQMNANLGQLSEKIGQIQQRVDKIDSNLQRAPWILR
jgi:methyl-accepting chemotaxis protein